MRTLKIIVGDVVIARIPLLNGDHNDAGEATRRRTLRTLG
jgi:hypothetical protein